MCKKCEWEENISRIEDMLSDSDYDFASDTLEGIKDWVTENQHITGNQLTAIGNIEGSKRE